MQAIEKSFEEKEDIRMKKWAIAKDKAENQHDNV